MSVATNFQEPKERKKDILIGLCVKVQEDSGKSEKMFGMEEKEVVKRGRDLRHFCCHSFAPLFTTGGLLFVNNTTKMIQFVIERKE